MKRFLMVLLVISVFMLMALGQVSYAAPKDDSAISGKVVETMDSGGYTYVCLEKKGKKTWVAVPQMKVKKGQNMSFQPGTEMVNFKSKTLNRTFDRVIFSGGAIK
ncbi:MAG: hypothetical protein HZA11_04355 [Nitrospirae bacterium]|nr:hypothetical protein [Nitrospirota bacterium]